MKSMITRWEYVFIALGMLLIPLGIGLVIIAVVAWRIGTKMEQGANKMEDISDTGEESENIDETYKCDEYAPEVLEDGK